MNPEEKTVDAVTPEADVTAEKEPKELTPEEIQKRLDRLEYLEKESKEAFKQRDEAKRKLKEQEEQKEKERQESLQKQGKFEELNQELLRKQAEWERERQDLLTLKEEKSILEQGIKSDLLNRIPEAKRKFVERFSIEELKEFAALEEAANPAKPLGTGDGARPGRKGVIDYDKVSIGDLSDEEKEIFAKSNPNLFRQKTNEYLSKQRKF